jgi:hypothetical protein
MTALALGGMIRAILAAGVLTAATACAPQFYKEREEENVRKVE